MDCKGRSIVGSCTSHTAGAHSSAVSPWPRCRATLASPPLALFYEPSHTERHTCIKLILPLLLSLEAAQTNGVADLRRSTSRGRARRNNVGDG